MTGQLRYTFQQPEGLLAHYTSAAPVFEHIVVPEGRLRMSPYRKMRDPAENQDIIPGTVWRGNQPGAERAWVDMIDHVKRVRDAMRVLSFTRDAVDQVSSHPRTLGLIAAGRGPECGSSTPMFTAVRACCWTEIV